MVKANDNLSTEMVAVRAIYDHGLTIMQVWKAHYNRTVSRRERHKVINAQSMAHAYKSRAPWTTGDERNLLVFAEQGFSNADTASRMGRTIDSVKRRKALLRKRGWKL